MKYEYKIISESDLEVLESTINELGRNGWKVISMLHEYEDGSYTVTLERAKLVSNSRKAIISQLIALKDTHYRVC